MNASDADDETLGGAASQDDGEKALQSLADWRKKWGGRFGHGLGTTRADEGSRERLRGARDDGSSRGGRDGAR